MLTIASAVFTAAVLSSTVTDCDVPGHEFEIILQPNRPLSGENSGWRHHDTVILESHLWPGPALHAGPVLSEKRPAMVPERPLSMWLHDDSSGCEGYRSSSSKAEIQALEVISLTISRVVPYRLRQQSPRSQVCSYRSSLYGRQCLTSKAETLHLAKNGLVSDRDWTAGWLVQ